MAIRNSLRMNYQYSQRGATLVIGLILLLLLTFLGLNLLWTTMGEERSAGGLRNKELSFESTEGGLREVARTMETYATNAQDPILNYVDGGGTAVTEYQYWSRVFDWSSKGVALTKGSGVAEAPRAYIERTYDRIEFDDVPKTAYRVTVRGRGANSDAESIVQAVVLE